MLQRLIGLLLEWLGGSMARRAREREALETRAVEGRREAEAEAGKVEDPMAELRRRFPRAE